MRFAIRNEVLHAFKVKHQWSEAFLTRIKI